MSSVPPDLLRRGGLVQVGSVAGAEAVLAALQAAGYGPSAVTYTTLLALYGRTGQLARAEAVFAVMRETGCRPGLPAYTALLAAYGKAGRPDQAERCFHQIKVRPSGAQARPRAMGPALRKRFARRDRGVQHGSLAVCAPLLMTLLWPGRRCGPWLLLTWCSCD